MAKGAIGKTEVISRIAKAFGDDYIGEIDKKVYVWANENGERVQIALALTCPKVPVVTEIMPQTNTGDWDFSDDAATPTVVTAAKAEITDEERQKVADLMAKLGL